MKIAAFIWPLPDAEERAVRGFAFDIDIALPSAPARSGSKLSPVALNIRPVPTM